MDDTVARLEAVAVRLEKALAKLGGEPEEGEVPEYCLTYEALLAKEGQAFFDACAAFEKAGFDVAIIKGSFDCVAKYLRMTTVAKKPTAQQCVAFCQKDLVDAAAWAQKLCGTRDKKLFKYGNYHKFIAEVLQCNYWVSMYPPQLPAKHAETQFESGMFNANRILKDKTEENKKLVNTFKAFFKSYTEFIKKEFKTGITFVGKESIDKAAAPAGGAKKAAPAPKKEEVKEEEVAPKVDAKAAEKKGAALLAGLQKGLNATAGLKKVKKSQKNKYKKEKVSGKVTLGPKKAKVKNKKKAVKKKQGPYNWAWCNYTDADGQQTISTADKITMSNGLSFQDCTNAMFLVEKECKVKSVVIDACRRCQFQVSDVVSSIEIMNSRDIKIWCMGMVPSVTIDKTDSPHIIFTKGCIEASGGIPSVTTASVTAGNVEIPGAGPDDDSQMVPMPEQYILTVSADGKCVATPMDYGE